MKHIGCQNVLIEDGNLHKKIRKLYPDGINSVMDIIGNSTLLDSLKIIKKAGTICCAGFLGGGDSISFNPLTDMPSSVNLNFFASFMFGNNELPLNNVPLQDIVYSAEQGKYKIQPARIFNFEEISLAHEFMESNNACGKIVIQII